MGQIYIPTSGPEDWKPLLGDPNIHWEQGHSAMATAHCWEEAKGFPPEIFQIFSQSDVPSFQNIELLLAFPEHKVTLAGRGADSQNDVFVLAKANDGYLVSIAVEGKVSEPFGNKTVGQWIAEESENKWERLDFLRNQLGLTEDFPLHIRYQLIHRTASAIIEAKRFNAPRAAMIVHSFSQDDKWFEDYAEFLKFLGAKAAHDKLVFVRETQGIDLYSGWARGDAKYLEV